MGIKINLNIKRKQRKISAETAMYIDEAAKSLQFFLDKCNTHKGNRTLLTALLNSLNIELMQIIELMHEDYYKARDEKSANAHFDERLEQVAKLLNSNLVNEDETKIFLDQKEHIHRILHGGRFIEELIPEALQHDLSENLKVNGNYIENQNILSYINIRSI